MATQIQISIDDIFQGTALGSLDKAIGNNIYGFNHTQIPAAIPHNRERGGFTFFTRPQLNLQGDNCRNARKFMPLVSDNSDLTIHRVVRCLLDPRQMQDYTFGKSKIPAITCPLVANNQAFLTLLTNNIISCSGWPDPTLPMYSSTPGRYNESMAFADGMIENMEQFTVTCTFRNSISDPILYLFYIWTLYASYVFRGQMIPYIDYMVNNRIDYNTRIWRIRTDRNNRKMTKLMCSGGAIPEALPMGQYADFNIEEAITSTNKDISIPFRCTGFEYYDDRLVYEFNATVVIFNPNMGNDLRPTNMMLVPRNLSSLFSYRAYPRINVDTHDMEWWVDKALFDERTQRYLLGAVQQQALQDARDGVDDPDEGIDTSDDSGADVDVLAT